MVTVNGRFLTQTMTGSQRVAYEITRRLVSRNPPDVEVMMPTRKMTTPIPDTLSSNTKETGRLQGHVWEQIELGRYANRRGGVLWSPVNVGPVNAKNHVVTIHDVFSIQTPQWVSRSFHTWYSFLLPRLAKSSRHVITVSQYSKETIVEALDVPEDKVSVIELGVDPKFSPGSTTEVERVREKYGLPERFILTLGSLEPRKNLSRVVEAWSQLDVDWRPPLYIAGGRGVQRVFGSHDDESLDSHDDIHLLGYIDEADLAPLYSAASVFVYASLLEGFGLPPLEALACGTPIVLSDTSAMRETNLGLASMVNPEQPDSIASGISDVLRADRPETFRLEAANAVRKRFDWDKTSDRVREVLKTYE